MYSDWVLAVFGGIVFLWLGVLNYLVWQQGNFLKSLFPKSGERDIRKKFEEVLAKVEGFGGDLDKLNNKLAEVEQQGLKHIQRVELLRFNPYDDTGGNISFTLALLDDKGDGFVITSLHARSGTRIFAKPVIKGESDSIKFSKEEEEAIKKALS